MSLYRRGETWWLDIAVHGKPRIRRSTGTADLQEAQRIHDQARAEAWQSARAGHTWTDAATAWLTDAGERHINDRYRLRLISERLGSPALAGLDTAAITTALSGQRAGNWNRSRNLIVAVLNVAKLRGWIESIPHIPSKKVAPARIRFLTADEWSRLEAALPDHMRPMAQLAIYTGLRQHNVTHMEWSQVDLARRVAWVHADQAKAQKAIGVPLSDDAVAVLRAQSGRHPRWVFPNTVTRWEDGKPAEWGSQSEIKTAWRTALRRADIEPGFRWHDLRHTWASVVLHS